MNLEPARGAVYDNPPRRAGNQLQLELPPPRGITTRVGPNLGACQSLCLILNDRSPLDHTDGYFYTGR
jgi:hypothetical protein